MFPYFSAPDHIVCIGNVIPAPRAVVAILQDEHKQKFENSPSTHVVPVASISSHKLPYEESYIFLP